MPLHDQKLEQILELINGQPYWTSLALTKKLGISRSTVQKCLQELHDAGLVVRIHGGVRGMSKSLSSPVPLDERLSEDRLAKENICSEALKLVPRQGYIYIDAGTTTLPLALKMAGGGFENGLMCVTNDVAIASALAKLRIKHMLLGGQLHAVTQTISGAVTEEQLLNYQFDLCFISVDSIWPNGSVTSALVEESRLKCQAMRQSNQKVLLAATSKFSKKSGAMIGKIDDFNIWITEKNVPTIAKLCKVGGVELITCQSEKK